MESGRLLPLSPSPEIVAMEHLPRVSDPAHPDWEVPYLNVNGPENSHWDGGDFAQFPARQGWNVENLYAGLYQQEHTHHQTSTMLQEWLYFGMLAEVLARPINRMDFLRKNETGTLVLTTVLLQDYLFDWIAINSSIPKEAQDVNRFYAKKAIEVASYYINRHPSTNMLSPLSDDIIMSIRLLGDSLGRWGTMHVWKSVLILHRGVPTLLKGAKPEKPEAMVYGFSASDAADTKMMVERTKHWCPYERHLLTASYSVSTVFYLSSLKPLPTSAKDHRQCSKLACLAYNVDTADYKTKHDDTCAEVDCEFLGVTEEHLTQVVENNGLPLILMETEDDDVVSLTVVPWEEGMEFIAISHVWSDGLGNATENSLPKCQLRKIAEALTSEVGTGGLGVPFNDEASWRRLKRPESFAARAEEFDLRSAMLKKRNTKATLRAVDYLTGDLEETEYWTDAELRKGKDDHHFQSSWAKLHDEARNGKLPHYVKRGEIGWPLSNEALPQTKIQMLDFLGSEKFAAWLQAGFPGVSSPPADYAHFKLPRGWERRETDSGQTYYVDHNTRSTTWDKPSVITESKKPLLFWMDTLCIPKERNLRRKAIQEMTDVYDQAESVVVLDSQLRQISLVAPQIEIMGRVVMCGWMKRMWTYQEGILARSLNFRLRDGNLGYEETHLEAKIYGMNDLVSQNIFQSFPAAGHGSFKKKDRFTKLMEIMETLSSRSLSRPGDEVLVLCFLLRMSKAEITQIMDLPKDQRIQRFWSLQERIPRGIAFWVGPKVEDQGFRWAPSTLLGRQRGFREMPPYNAAKVVSPYGLYAKYIGWVFTTDRPLTHSFYMMDKNTRTLLNVYPAHDEKVLNKWVQGTHAKPLTYGVIVLSPVPTMRYTYGVLLAVYKREAGKYYTNYVCQVNVEKAREGDFFALGRFSRSLGNMGMQTSTENVHFSVTTENDIEEPWWYIG